MAGANATAPGHEETSTATAITASMPHPIGVSASDSRPSGMSTNASTAQGMIHSAVSGTASMLVASPNTASRLKWKAANGDVASPATSEVSATAARYIAGRAQAGAARRRAASGGPSTS